VAGVGAGLLLACALALALLGLAAWLPGDGPEWFQAIMALAASALVVQMVVWMRRHGRGLKRELQASAAQQVDSGHWWGLLVLVMVAVAREGSETVVFLYGSVLSSQQHGGAGAAVLAGLGGFAVALATFWLLQLGGKVITWRRFFQLTEVLLLLLAGGLLVGACDRLIALGALPTLMDPVWDSSALLDTGAGLGKLLADFAGYRATPALSQLLIWLAYWAVVAWLLRRSSHAPAPHAVTGGATWRAEQNFFGKHPPWRLSFIPLPRCARPPFAGAWRAWATSCAITSAPCGACSGSSSASTWRCCSFRRRCRCQTAPPACSTTSPSSRSSPSGACGGPSCWCPSRCWAAPGAACSAPRARSPNGPAGTAAAAPSRAGCAGAAGRWWPSA
jgi:high-affinity iron transporter